jgi:hypothetical protein
MKEIKEELATDRILLKAPDLVGRRLLDCLEDIKDELGRKRLL